MKLYRLKEKFPVLYSPLSIGIYITLIFFFLSINYYNIRSLNDSERVTNFLYDLIETLDLKSEDLFFKWRGPIDPPDNIALVAIDDEALKKIGRWPWPRSLIAKLIDQIFQYEPKSLGLDIVFSEQDHTNSNVFEKLKKFNLLKTNSKQKTEDLIPSEDIELSNVIQKNKDKIVLGTFGTKLFVNMVESHSSFQDYCRNIAFQRINSDKFVKLNSSFIVDDLSDDFVELPFDAILNPIFDQIEKRATEKFLRFVRVTDEKLLEKYDKNELESIKHESDLKYCYKWFKSDDNFLTENITKQYRELFKGTKVELFPKFTKSIDQFIKMIPAHPIPQTDLWTINTDLIQNSAEYTASFNAEQDQDGSIRHSPLFFRTGNKIGLSFIPSLALQTYLVGTGYQARVLIRQDESNAKQKIISDFFIVDPKIMKECENPENCPEAFIQNIPVNKQGRIRMNYYGPGNTLPYISAAEILNDKQFIGKKQMIHSNDGKFVIKTEYVNKEDFIKDKFLILGPTAVGIYDLRVTPFDKNFPGPETHLTTLANLLDGNFYKISNTEYVWMPWLILLIGISFTLLINYLNATYSFIFGLFSLVSLYIAEWFVFKNGIFFTNIIVLFLLLSLLIILNFYKYLLEENKKNYLRTSFSKYVSPKIVDQILQHPENLKLGGQKLRLTVFFSDIRGFTQISEKLDPESLTNLLNEYLTPMSDIITDNMGTIDKYMGDAIMAFFGAPVVYNDHAIKACRAALQNIECLEELKLKFNKRNLPSIEIGIGLNTAEVSVGNMGSSNIQNYTVMGDGVNLGSRIEGLNKEYGTQILISEYTYNEVQTHFTTREIDFVRVKGKDQAIKIYELISEGPPNKKKQEILNYFSEALVLYRKKHFNKALEVFLKVIDIDPEDGPTLVYLRRCEELISNPPPEDWDGIMNMKTK